MKSRRLIAWLIVLVAVAATPIAVRAAYIWRGYWAIGGEWAVIPMGIMAAWIWLDETRRWGCIYRDHGRITSRFYKSSARYTRHKMSPYQRALSRGQDKIGKRYCQLHHSTAMVERQEGGELSETYQSETQEL